MAESTQGKILLVEDDKFTARMMELQFHKSGYDIEIASSGEEALQLVDQQDFDVVLSDVVMPNLTGLDMLRTIRETYDAETLPVILVTANEQSTKINEAFRLGVNDFFTKPKEFALTEARVAQQIALKRARNAASSRAQRLSGDGLWNWSITKGTAQFSQAFKDILGEHAKHLDQRVESWFDLIHPDDRTGFDTALDRHMRRKSSWLESNVRIGSGDDLIIHIFGVALFDRSGQPVRMLGAIHVTISTESLNKRAAKILSRLDQLLAAGPMTEAGMTQLGEIRDQLGRLFQGG